MSRFRLSPEALADIREIVEYIAHDSLDASERILEQLYSSFAIIARSPGIGHTRKNLTNQAVLFWPVGVYMVIYHRDVRPVHVVAVLHGKRNLKKLLASRPLQISGSR